MEKYCPLQQEAVTCAAWCVWYDELDKRCEISEISERLASLEDAINYITVENDKATS